MRTSMNIFLTYSEVPLGGLDMRGLVSHVFFREENA